MEKLASIFILCLIISGNLTAQISHGGKPLPMTLLNTRSTNGFEEMPSFDVNEQLRIDSLNESDLRSGFHFAYKFITDYTSENSGTTFTLVDGTRIWRLGIRSAGAYSINVLFSEYELPEGAQLFLYNPDQTHILGSFTHLNNSKLGILPVSPVVGDELIIEYQEPANAAFRGKLKVGEVNHAYRSIPLKEPQGDNSFLWCMPALACAQLDTDKYDEIGRSVILLMINGETACSGVLVNNTQNDGKPYLLTASHCLNNNFGISNPDYETIAGNIVSFFNYNSPLCNPVMRGTEEMSMASCYFRATNEHTDMALLELTETPPAYYQPYYSGWNAKDKGKAPYTGIHHPNASVKRVNTTDKVEYGTYPTGFFLKNVHWFVEEWTTGSTFGGSSGSPLFDDNNQVVGCLSGGRSSCPQPYEEFYYALDKSWEQSPDADKQLKTWLDPTGKSSTLALAGLDPYRATPCIRLSNIRESGKTEKIGTTPLPAPQSGPAFGNNSLGITEYAESYLIAGKAKVYGTYLINPSVTDAKNIEVEIKVYSGSQKPENLLYISTFKPTFLYNKDDKNKNFTDSVKPLDRNQESFVTFPNPIPVSGKFFIGYRIKSSTGKTTFSVYNLPKGETTKNTTWLNYQNQWVEATSHPATPMSTSLFIDPVIQYDTESANESIDTENPIRIFTGTTPGIFHIVLPESIRQARYSLLAVNGSNLQSGTIQNGQNTIPTHTITPGIYLIRVDYKNKSYTQKVIF